MGGKTRRHAMHLFAVGTGAADRASLLLSLASWQTALRRLAVQKLSSCSLGDARTFLTALLFAVSHLLEDPGDVLARRLGIHWGVLESFYGARNQLFEQAE